MKRLYLTLLLLASPVIAPAEEVHEDVPEPQALEVIVTTADDHKLRCTYIKPVSDKEVSDARGVILVHMLGAKKSDWLKLPGKLAHKGFAVLVLQLRGHGSHVRDEDYWTTYEKEDFNKMTLDVTAARVWLKKQRHVNINKIGLVGARLGANVALNAMKGDDNLLAAYCLSPAASYRGVKVDTSLEGFGDRPLMFVAAQEDAFALESFDAFEKAGASVSILDKDDSELDRGMELLGSRENLDDQIVTWLNDNL